MISEQLSVVEALKQAHINLLKDLAELEDTLKSSAGKDSAAMHSRLERARADILEHFRFEELNGYMDAVLHRQPNLARSVEDLREEHRQLTQELDQLIERARTGRRLEEAFCEQVCSWLQSVRRHESSENILVQDAFNVDFSGID